MTAANRATVLGKIHKVLKKHYKPVVPPTGRTVLETLLFGGVVENADFETAEETFAKLQESFFDWNELRVTTITELSEVMAALPDAVAAAQRVKKVLQAVFETHYQFDLEALKKQNLGKSVADIEKFPGITPFMVAYAIQNALAGHAIALGKGAWDVLFAVGATTEQEFQKKHVPGLERAIQKNKGSEFFSLLHQCGVDLAASPQSTRVKSILQEIDGEAKERLTQWHAKRPGIEHAMEQQERKAAREAMGPPLIPDLESKKKPAKGTTDDKAEKGKPAKTTAAKPAVEKAPEKPAEKAEKPAKAEKSEKPAKGSKEKAAPKEKEGAKAITKRKPK